MLDIRYVVENAGAVKDRLALRSGSYDVDAVVRVDALRRKILKDAEALRAERNRVSDEIALLKREKKNADAQIAAMKTNNERIKALDEKLDALEKEERAALLSIPNLPHGSVPPGKTGDDNKVVRVWGEPRKFAFTPRAHWEIGEALGILDPVTAAKITGARFTVYRGAGARLERSLFNFMLDTHAENGYVEIFPPFMVNRESMTGTGQLPKFEEDAFAVKDTNYFLVPTAEVPVTNMHRGEVIRESDLPIRYAAYTACFRAEAGSAGRDTRGLIRQHQFNKVELVKFTTPQSSFDELETLTAEAELILQRLNLPYRVVTLCTGDLGFSSAKTYDIEVWMPSYGRYVEISSCSNFMDYQARRMNIKYKEENGKTAFLHTLNGSGLAVGRTTAAILENFQNADGTVTLPDAIAPYAGVGIIR
ncbi:MAG: serine--tRNA ligase [Clostridiales bacterium]|jgi:seryl-tRNA synthetase|nr:serine--tRNA ligase [Clostridiales bacterium]